MVDEPDLPALFEKRSEIKQELRAHMALVTRSEEPRAHMA